MSYKRQTHCHMGHPLSGDNVGVQSTGNGKQRYCRACKREANRRYRKRQERGLERATEAVSGFPDGVVPIAVAGWGARS